MTISPAPRALAKKWFEKNRDLHVRELLDDFFRINHWFQYLFLVARDCRREQGRLCFDPEAETIHMALSEIGTRLGLMIGSEIEKGPLWRLKDDCHLMWRESNEERGMLVDWFIGSIFHETMKLKENIYLLHRYGPTAMRMKERSASHPPYLPQQVQAARELETLLNVQEMMDRIASDVALQLEQIQSLLEKARYVIRAMMPELIRNELVIRLLVEREEMVASLWGESLEELFSFFFGEAAGGFCAAGSSYMKGQWYPQALNMYQRALRADHNCNEALIRVAQLQAIVRENRELLGLG